MSSKFWCFVCSKKVDYLRRAVACDSCKFDHFCPCDFDHFQLDKLPTKRCDISYRWRCSMCNVQQARTASFHVFHSCVECTIALIRESGEKLSLAREAKLHFLQQINPSPLSGDFRGDVSFVVKGKENCGDQRIHAHRYILASKSPVFKAMMDNDMKEKLTGEIQLEGLSAVVVQAVVNFLYVGEIEFSDEVLPEDVLAFSHQYDIPWLKNACENELVKKITPANVVKMLSISHNFGAKILDDKAKEWLSEHMDDLEYSLEIFYAIS